MSVSIPSDLVLDVIRAAAPATVKTATQKLAGQPKAQFDNELASAGANLRADLIADVMRAADPAKAEAAGQKLAALSGSEAKGAYRQFEAMLLRNALEAMLPPAEANAFGDGYAGSVWRSMAADQFATVLADQGGLGIADLFSNRGPDAGAPRQWPYFDKTPLTSFQA